MPRDFIIYGESLVKVKGNVISLIPSISELGLAEDQIQVAFHFNNEDLHVNAWGPTSIVDKQVFPGFAMIHINLIHYDPVILTECQRLSQAGVAEGVLNHAGWRMGSAGARFAATNSFIGLNIQCAGVPSFTQPNWRFYYASLVETIPYPLGTQKAVIRTIWQAVPYTPDPWNGGMGANGTVWYDHTLDT